MPSITVTKPALLDPQSHRYRSSSTESKYTRHEGVLVIPVMGPAETPPVLIRVHAPYGERESEFEYIKSGTPPVFPAQDDTQSGDILLGSELQFPAPSSEPGGLPIYGIRGRYVYVQPLGGRTAGNDYPIDTHPIATAASYLDSFSIEVVGSLGNPETIANKIMDSVWNGSSVRTETLCSYNILR